MSHQFGKRVERLEDALIIGDERKELERQFRFYFNLRSVSDVALKASIEALGQGQPAPDWAEAEFQRPVPFDADTSLVREAMQQARQSVRLA